MIHDLALRSPRSLSICPWPGASLRGDAESYNTFITFGARKLSCFRDPWPMLVPFVWNHRKKYIVEVACHSWRTASADSETKQSEAAPNCPILWYPKVKIRNSLSTSFNLVQFPFVLIFFGSQLRKWTNGGSLSLHDWTSRRVTCRISSSNEGSLAECVQRLAVKSKNPAARFRHLSTLRCGQVAEILGCPSYTAATKTWIECPDYLEVLQAFLRLWAQYGQWLWTEWNVFWDCRQSFMFIVHTSTFAPTVGCRGFKAAWL